MVTRREPANTPLAKARRARQLRQLDVAKKIGVERVTYTHIERGSKRPSLDVAMRLAALFGKTVEELFGSQERDQSDG